ncbi:FCS-Like Zinc finger 8-like [Telopea speciosissima]|uniref:FCS-Like Zinc finger 8-like n=1 Tax=Telopea speciosissima TaxID=54955 RepID=UPI001CC3BC8C|nr:FCS-Like Zinc finger 8-like [Telopea speciosissima]XP_043702935.1 FCS-Like Zinc finger 8-like [Telopea speciosissima]XP_043702936.1 FCS-Like Zinc finger 8-like [Telopea speciosissima]
MLRKRSRSIQKDQYKGHLMSDSASETRDFLGQKLKSGSFFSVPGLFIGFNTKGSSDSDSARSPTSPLDYKVFANLANPFRSPRASPDGPQKSWDCSKVGLGIVDSLKDEVKPFSKGPKTSESKSILFGSQFRNPSSPKHLFDSVDSSLPKVHAVSPNSQLDSPRLQLDNSDNVFRVGETRLQPKPLGKVRSWLFDSDLSATSLNSLTYLNTNLSSEDLWVEKKTAQVNSPSIINGGSNFDNSLVMKPSSLPVSFGSDVGIMGSLSAREIELSEDYTCVISHGPNPRKTHIFGDCILECHGSELTNSKKEERVMEFSPKVKCLDGSVLYPSDDFLSYCCACKKKLEQGKDIYMYRGEKAFCSSSCRSQEILVEEEMEKTVNNSSENSPGSTYPEKIFL